MKRISPEILNLPNCFQTVAKCINMTTTQLQPLIFPNALSENVHTILIPILLFLPDWYGCGQPCRLLPFSCS